MSTENKQPDSIPERKHSLFDDPNLNQNIQEDPFVRFVVLKWKGVLTFFLIIAAAIYLKAQISETSLARVKESSQVFDQARSALESLNDQTKTPSQEEKDKLQLSITDSLANLKSGAEPYAELSSLYSTLASNQDLSATAPAWKTEKDLPKRLIKELQTLVLIRKSIDSEKGYEAGITDLKTLAKEGNFADLSAFMLFARIAEKNEDKQFVKDLAVEMKARYAEQAEKIDTAISTL